MNKSRGTPELTHEEFFQLRPKIGKAIWLLNYYWSFLWKDESGWIEINGGYTGNDAMVASELRVSTFTAMRWRKKLERLGLAQVHPRGDSFRVLVYRPLFEGKRFVQRLEALNSKLFAGRNAQLRAKRDDELEAFLRARKGSAEPTDTGAKP